MTQFSNSLAHDDPDGVSRTGTQPLHAGIVFLARLLGTSVQSGRLQEALESSVLAGSSAAPGIDVLQDLLNHADLVGTLLPEGQRRPTELPALVVGADGKAMVVLSLREGGYECHLPGIEGVSWLNAAAIAEEVPRGRWVAVRARLYFDQRSLLYTPPEAGRLDERIFKHCANTRADSATSMRRAAASSRLLRSRRITNSKASTMPAAVVSTPRLPSAAFGITRSYTAIE